MTTTKTVPKLPPGLRRLPSGNVRWEKMVDGRRMSGSARTVKEALAAQAQATTEAVRGTAIDPSMVTVGEYLAGWLESKRASRSQTSHTIQAKLLERYIAPDIGDKRLQKFTPAELRRFYSGLRSLKGVAGQPAPPLGAASQRQIHQFLKQAFQDALREELIMRNVCDIIQPTPPRTRTVDEDGEEVDAYDPTEARAFMLAAEAEPDRWWAAFALATGLRRGELCGLRWVDIDWAKGTARIRENVVEDAGKIRVTTLKTKESRRVVYLSAYAVRLLRQQQEHQRHMAEALKAGKMAGHSHERRRPWQDSGRIWTDTRGGIMHPGNLRRSMARAYTAAGVRHLHLHGLRDTYASLALMAGVPVEVVSRQLGHTDPAFTLRRYRRVFQVERANWALDLTDMLTPKKSPITHELRTGEKSPET